MTLKLTIEDVGHFFDEYVLVEDEKLIGDYAEAKKIPKKYRNQLAEQVMKEGKLTPDEAHYFVELARS